jgi:predicted RND superfamily exporter protein
LGNDSQFENENSGNDPVRPAYDPPQSDGTGPRDSTKPRLLRSVWDAFQTAPTPVAIDPDGRSTFLEKWATTILCLALFASPFVLTGTVRALKVYSSDIRQWLPDGFEESKVYDEFIERFGVDEMVVLSWEDCTIDNPQILLLQDALEKTKIEIKDEETGEISESLVFDRVVTGPDVITKIENSGVKTKHAHARVQGLMIGPDKKTTCVVAYPRKEVFSDRRMAIARVYELAEEIVGVAPADLKIGGPTADAATIESESKRSLGTFLWMSVVLVAMLTWYRMRDLPLTLLVIGFAGVCSAISLSILYWSGGKMNMTLIMLPTLTFILGVSGCVHMVNYYRKAATLGYGMRSADQAMADGIYPVLLSSITTAVGLLSLGSSTVKPIQMFGFYSACGVMASSLVMLFVLPAALYLLRGRISKRFSDDGKMGKRERTTGVSRSTSLLLNWVCRHNGIVVLPTLIAVVILSLGVFKLKASVKLQNRFASRAKIISDYGWLESKLGPLVPMEVELRFGPGNGLTKWNQMQIVQSIERSIKQTTAVNATLSAATFEPTVPRGRTVLDRVNRSGRIEKWTEEFHQLENANLVRVIDGTAYWRISLRVAALNDIDYGDFLEMTAENVDEQIKHLNVDDMSASLTGGIPLVYKAQHQILTDLMLSFLTAFLIITVIMMIVLRNIQAGLVAMVPNVFPPLVVFGAMGWFQYSVEIGAVMTASVALGIAVDDTLHFLTWYRRGTVEGLSRFASIRHAFEHCAKAMIDTSLICGLGVIPFLFGVFMPTAKFAALLLIMLMTALPGDLILLPAMLAGPVGVLFRLRGKRKKASKPDQDGEPVEPVETIRRQG